MLPRHADVMAVLEDVPGVVAVYALANRGFDIALEVTRMTFVPRCIGLPRRLARRRRLSGILGP